MVDNWNILKTGSPFFQENLFLPKLWAKMLSGNHYAGFFRMKYLRKEVNDKVYFWHASKRGSLLQVYTIILGVCSQAYPKCQNKKFRHLCNIS